MSDVFDLIYRSFISAREASPRDSGKGTPVRWFSFLSLGANQFSYSSSESLRDVGISLSDLTPVTAGLTTTISDQEPLFVAAFGCHKRALSTLKSRGCEEQDSYAEYSMQQERIELIQLVSKSIILSDDGALNQARIAKYLKKQSTQVARVLSYLEHNSKVSRIQPYLLTNSRIRRTPKYVFSDYEDGWRIAADPRYCWNDIANHGRSLLRNVVIAKLSAEVVGESCPWSLYYFEKYKGVHVDAVLACPRYVYGIQVLRDPTESIKSLRELKKSVGKRYKGGFLIQEVDSPM